MDIGFGLEEKCVFLAGKAGGELLLSLSHSVWFLINQKPHWSHSGLTMAIHLELARAFYYLFDFTSIRFDNEPPIRFYNCLAMASSLPFLSYNESILQRRIQVRYSFLTRDAQELAKD